jgi:hypothetical protein
VQLGQHPRAGAAGPTGSGRPVLWQVRAASASSKHETRQRRSSAPPAWGSRAAARVPVGLQVRRRPGVADARSLHPADEEVVGARDLVAAGPAHRIGRPPRVYAQCRLAVPHLAAASLLPSSLDTPLVDPPPAQVRASQGAPTAGTPLMHPAPAEVGADPFPPAPGTPLSGDRAFVAARTTLGVAAARSVPGGHPHRSGEVHRTARPGGNSGARRPVRADLAGGRRREPDHEDESDGERHEPRAHSRLLGRLGHLLPSRCALSARGELAQRSLASRDRH